MTADITEVRPVGAQPGAAVPARSRHLGLALVVISMAQLMLVLDELIVNTALPHIQQALHFSGTGLEWVVTGYAVTFAGLLMLGGLAGDILGRRRVVSAGIFVFTLPSLPACPPPSCCLPWPGRLRAAQLRARRRRDRGRRPRARRTQEPDPRTRRRRRSHHRVRGHRGPVGAAADARVDLRQPEPGRRLPDPALPGRDI